MIDGPASGSPAQAFSFQRFIRGSPRLGHRPPAPLWAPGPLARLRREGGQRPGPFASTEVRPLGRVHPLRRLYAAHKPLVGRMPHRGTHTERPPAEQRELRQGASGEAGRCGRCLRRPGAVRTLPLGRWQPDSEKWRPLAARLAELVAWRRGALGAGTRSRFRKVGGPAVSAHGRPRARSAGDRRGTSRASLIGATAPKFVRNASAMGRTRMGPRHDRLATQWACPAGPACRGPMNGAEVRLHATEVPLLLVTNQERGDTCAQTSHCAVHLLP
jgi:hypothetical protein